MTKGLEALEKIKNKPIVSLPESPIKRAYDKNKEECDIIEAELKRLDDLDKWFFDDKDYKKYKALEIIKNCICGEYELKDNCDTNNPFNSPYRFRIYMSEYEYNEWILKSKEEYDLLKEVLL